jgi:sugar O-acyltransferase (sialic acid O-acetyltransferase NeuD family)
MKSLVIFGCGEFAQVAHRYFTDDSSYQVEALTVDRRFVAEKKILGLNVIPFEEIEQRFPPGHCDLFVAVGYSRINRARREVVERCKAKGYRLASYFCSRAVSWDQPQLGENTFVFESNVLQPFVQIGRNVILWSGNHIGHHTVIEDDCFIAGHAIVAGSVRVGRGTFIGVNATVSNNVVIGAENIIGAGALITGNTQDNQVYRGHRSLPADISSDRLWS